MGWRPQLNVICGRCGKPSGPLRHVCVSNSTKKQTLTLQISYGKCPDCRKRYDAGGQLTHQCAPKSDFGKRKKQFEQEQRARSRKARPQHDYAECSDGECKRPLCAAYKAGRALGEADGYELGWELGYDRGEADARERK